MPHTIYRSRAPGLPPGARRNEARGYRLRLILAVVALVLGLLGLRIVPILGSSPTPSPATTASRSTLERAPTELAVGRMDDGRTGADQRASATQIVTVA
jgi:hypothetical protein